MSKGVGHLSEGITRFILILFFYHVNKMYKTLLWTNTELFMK